MPSSSRQSRHLPAFILLALTEGPLHGHAIRSALQETLPGYKADRGPARKVYALAPSGWEHLDQWKTDIEKRLAFLQIFLDRYDRSKGMRVHLE